MLVSMATGLISGLASLAWKLLWSLLSPVPLTIIAITFALVYYKMTRNYEYWSSRGFPYARPKFPWGTEFGPPFISSPLKFEDWLYHKQGGKKYIGYLELTTPCLYVGDLDLIRHITIKDFEHFTDRRELVLNNDFKKMLFVLQGVEWKQTRAVMSPTFSSSKLRHMHQLCLDNAENLDKFVQHEMRANGEISLKDCFGRFTMDNIASCAFGVNCNSFTDANTEFASNAAKLFDAPKGYAAMRMLGVLSFGLDNMSWAPDPLADTVAFFKNAVSTTIAHRTQNGGSERQDFLQLLLDTRDKQGNRVLSDESIVAQCILFFIVGYDTTATLLLFAAYCIATEPDVQDQVISEIDDTLEKHGGRLSYEAVNEMTYTDRVMSETLRLYSPILRQERLCTKDYRIPDTDLVIPRGAIVQIPIHVIQRDPDYFPDPFRFDPDRFLPEEKEKRHPCAYMPFGAGPRNCIAMRFALFEAKVALVALLRQNRFEPGPSTPKPPMPLDDSKFILSPQPGSGKLKVVPR